MVTLWIALTCSGNKELAIVFQRGVREELASFSFIIVRYVSQESFIFLDSIMIGLLKFLSSSHGCGDRPHPPELLSQA